MGECNPSRLTPRESEVLRRLCIGDANKEIAAALGCSVKTVEFHLSNLLRKHGVSSRLQLVLAFRPQVHE